MNDLNRFALYNFRGRLSGWLKRRAKIAAHTGDIERAMRLSNLISRNESRLTETSPFGVESFSH